MKLYDFATAKTAVDNETKTLKKAAKRYTKEKQKMTDHKLTEKWECFCDAAYYDMWAVRDANGSRAFTDAIHVRTKKEAEFLVERLNRTTPQPPVIEGLSIALLNTVEPNYLKEHGEWGLCCGDKLHAEAILKAARLYAQVQTAQPQGDLVLCRRVIKVPEHEGATGYEYFVPVKEAQHVDLDGFDKQPTEDAQRALDALETIIVSQFGLCGNTEPLDAEIETIRAALTQQELEVVDVDSVEPIIDRSAARHLSEKGYQIVRKKDGALH